MQIEPRAFPFELRNKTHIQNMLKSCPFCIFVLWFRYICYYKCSMFFVETLCAVWSIALEKSTHIKYCLHSTINLLHLVRICHGSSRLCTAAGADDTGGVSCAQKSQSLGSEKKNKNDPEQHWRRHSFVNICIYIYIWVNISIVYFLYTSYLHHDLIPF